MKTYEITSLTNERVKAWTKLHQPKYRKESGQFLVEGEHLILEAEKAGLIDTLIGVKGVPHSFMCATMVEVTPEIMRKLCVTESNSDFVAVCSDRPHPASLGQRILLLDMLQDPGNVGTILRTAYSFGFESVVVSENSVDLTNEKVIRGSQGAIFHIPTVQADLQETIRQLKARHIPVIGTGLKNAVAFETLPLTSSVAFVLGNEGAGVRKEILDLCDTVVKIEMSAFESLNVAIAAGILCYRFRKP
ncbi:MAG: RNA methyltransferase [Erysipelotrichales bacterium]|nr:MAG: RNA methyltransferase [Erysipelotrichales bacterium]